jgi:hypothetical protein
MDWYRSTSTGTTAGSSFTVPFTGTGIDVIGGNDGTAVLDVYLDGKLIARDAKTAATDKRLATYALRGLPDGAHTARFVLKSGKIVLDAFNAISGDVDRTVDTTPIRDALEKIGRPEQADYTAGSWALFASASSAAKTAASGRQKGLDAIGVEQITDRLEEAHDRLVRKDGTAAQ